MLVLVLTAVRGQYTIFEQLKNYLIRVRTTRLRAAAGATAAVAAVLTDMDYFFLGAVSKLSAFSL